MAQQTAPHASVEMSTKSTSSKGLFDVEGSVAVRSAARLTASCTSSLTRVSMLVSFSCNRIVLPPLPPTPPARPADGDAATLVAYGLPGDVPYEARFGRIPPAPVGCAGPSDEEGSACLPAEYAPGGCSRYAGTAAVAPSAAMPWGVCTADAAPGAAHHGGGHGAVARVGELLAVMVLLGAGAGGAGEGGGGDGGLGEGGGGGGGDGEGGGGEGGEGGWQKAHGPHDTSRQCEMLYSALHHASQPSGRGGGWGGLGGCGGLGGGGGADACTGCSTLPLCTMLEMVKAAEERLHCWHPGPSSHDVSEDLCVGIHSEIPHT